MWWLIPIVLGLIFKTGCDEDVAGSSESNNNESKRLYAASCQRAAQSEFCDVFVPEESHEAQNLLDSRRCILTCKIFTTIFINNERIDGRCEYNAFTDQNGTETQPPTEPECTYD